jgi:hypothetical protein
MVLGNHIEMTDRPGENYDIGTTYQPQDHPALEGLLWYRGPMVRPPRALYARHSSACPGPVHAQPTLVH